MSTAILSPLSVPAASRPARPALAPVRLPSPPLGGGSLIAAFLVGVGLVVTTLSAGAGAAAGPLLVLVASAGTIAWLTSRMLADEGT